jgi:hypothetical protein
MQINPEVEQPTRTLLGYAISGHLDKIVSFAQVIGEQRVLDCLNLLVQVAGYVAIDACSWQWPTEADLREIAQHTAALENLDYELSATDVYDFLARNALGFELLVAAFPDPRKAATVPILATAALLVVYGAKAGQWTDYLDVIERSLAEALPLHEETVPALLLLARRHRALKDTDPA